MNPVDSLFRPDELADVLWNTHKDLDVNKVKVVVERRLFSPGTTHSNVYYHLRKWFTWDLEKLEELRTEQVLERDLRNIGSLFSYAATDQEVSNFRFFTILCQILCYISCVDLESSLAKALFDRIHLQIPKIVEKCKAFSVTFFNKLDKYDPKICHNLKNILKLKPPADSRREDFFSLGALTDHFMELYVKKCGEDVEKEELREDVSAILSARLKRENKSSERFLNLSLIDYKIQRFFTTEEQKRIYLKREISKLRIEKILDEEIRNVHVLANLDSLKAVWKNGLQLVKFVDCFNPNSEKLQKAFEIFFTKVPALIEKTSRLMKDWFPLQHKVVTMIGEHIPCLIRN